jgi:glycosyltransferase involved in cell wall biosynthesis
MGESLPISVVIPHHNRPQLLEAAIASIRRQTAPPAEIIIVDDCSLPVHRAELSKYSRDSKDIRVIFLDKPGGAPGARNAGIEAAAQEWIAFLDDDDEWLPGKLERQWKTLREDESLSAVSSALIVVSDGRPDWTQISHTPPIVTLAAALEDNVAMMQSTLIRAADIRLLRGFDENLSPFEDWEFWIRFTAAGYRCFYDREPQMILNRHRIQRVTAYWRNCLISRFKIIAKHRALFTREFGPGAVNRARSKAICRVGLERGRITGRALYACGCIFGGDIPRLMTLVTTGKMPIIPYSAS